MLGASTLTIYASGVGGTAKVLNRVKDDGYGAEYYLRESDGSYRVIINHTASKGRERHFIEIRRTIFATATTPEDTSKASFVLDSIPASAMTNCKNGCALSLSALIGYSVSTDFGCVDLLNWMS